MEGSEREDEAGASASFHGMIASATTPPIVRGGSTGAPQRTSELPRAALASPMMPLLTLCELSPLSIEDEEETSPGEL